jgi:long-chain acyl-CoA synthetase
VNSRLSVTERVRHHRLVPPFTVENGLLTPSQKIRRAAVLRAHLRPEHAEAGQPGLGEVSK